MLPLRYVKGPILLLFVFLLAFICAGVVFSALDMFFTWAYSTNAEPFTFGFVLQRLPRSAFQAAIPAVITALVLSAFRIVRKPFSRFLALAVCLGAGYLMLVNSMIWLHRLGAEVRQLPQAARQYIQPRSFLRMGDSLLSASSVTQNAVKGVLLYSPPEAPGPRLSAYPSGEVAQSNGTLSVRLANGRPMVLSQKLEPSYGSLLKPDAVSAFFLKDISVITADFERLLSQALGEFFIACFSLLFLCTASMAILRFTRWPLINIFFLILAIRGYFFLYHLLAVDLSPEIARVIADPLVSRLFPSAVFAVLGLLFLLVDILFIPTDRWKQMEAL